MLGAIVRLLVFVAAVVGATVAVSALLETEGGIAISAAGYEVFLTPLAAVAVLLGGFALSILALRLLELGFALLRLLTGDTDALGSYFRRGREQRGLAMLARAMTALASGDGRGAQVAAQKAERLLQRPDLTRLINAQAAEMAGDDRRARRYYTALASERETAFAGLKGLLGRALAEGDKETARRLAERAATLAPGEAGVLATLYRLQGEAFDWTGARRTLKMQRRIASVPPEEADRREATLALAQAEDAAAQGKRAAARRLAVEAATLDPANAEAVASATRLLIEDGAREEASRRLIEAWRAAPAPALAAAFATIAPEESAEARLARFQELFEANPKHRETRYLRAELALMAEDWAGARAAVESLGEREFSARSCALLAAIARGEGAGEAVVRGWLAKALGASRAGSTDSEIGRAAMLPLLIGENAAPEAFGVREFGGR